MGATTPGQTESNQLRQYLLGQLAADEEERVELRLMTDAAYVEQFDNVVDEITGQYVADELPEEERKQAEKHFFKSAERQDKLRFTMALHQHKRIPLPKPNPWRGYLAIAASVLIAVGLGLGIWLSYFRQSEVDRGLLALNSAYREQRPIESRISALNYAPFSTTRGPEADRVNKTDLQRAELTLLQALNSKPTPAVHHALGEVYLAKRQFDDAIKEFDEALKGDPRNSQLYSDLGAAWLEKGKIESTGPEPGKSLEDFARSLEKLDQALELNAKLLEALFNRAIVHQYLMLPKQAEDDWREYLKYDSTSPWAKEARRNLQSLQDQKSQSSQTKERLRQEFLSAYEARDSDRAWEVVRHSRDAFSIGKLIRDQLLDEYLQVATDRENQDAKSKLQALAFVGQIELKKTGDVYTSELSRFYSLSSPKQREILNHARDLMKLGQGYFAQAKPLEAVDVFEKSKQLFAGIGDPWEAQYAELWIGYCYLNASNTQRSMTILGQLASSFERQNHKWLLMRALHLLSGAEYNLSNYSKAIDHNQRSLALAEQMGDAIGAFNTLSILIEQYRYIGNYGRSLACVQQSLSLIGSCTLNERQIAQHYGIIASALASSGFFPAAADYQKEAMTRALTTGEVQTVSRAYANLGSIYGKMGDYNRALENTKLAYETAKSHSDESIRHGMMAYTSLQIANLYKQTGDITKAIESYDECLELYKSLDNYYGLYEAHKNRLSCYIAKRDDPAANEELKTTLGLVEKYRSQITEGDNRNHFFDAEQSVYDLAIDFEYSRMNNSSKAFEYSEASRSRSLLDSVNSNAKVSDDSSHPDIVFSSFSQPLTFRDIQERITERAQIIQYAVLSDKVLIWVVSRTTFETFESKVTQEELTQKVFRYLQAFSHEHNSQTTAATDGAKQLFEILIKPVEASLRRGNPVYVIPDKVLNYLPFSALVSPDSNRFLVEDYLTVISPSSSLLINCSAVAHKKEGKSVERLLSVGNPSFDRSEFPMLGELPSAAREAEEVARYYKSSCLLTGDAANKPRVKMEMEGSDVIHLAVHSVFDQHTPLRSKLILTKQQRTSATDDPSGGALEAREIYGMDLSRTRVVVLSACQSGVEQYFGGEGMISLARPFLAASVPLVVASLWPVDSDSTAELMISFHKHRKQDNLSSAEALRQAQLDMLKGSDERLRQPYYWASFTAIGGWTRF